MLVNKGKYKVYMRENDKNRLIDTFDSEEAMLEFAYYYRKEHDISGTEYVSIYDDKSIIFYDLREKSGEMKRMECD